VPKKCPYGTLPYLTLPTVPYLTYDTLPYLWYLTLPYLWYLTYGTLPYLTLPMVPYLTLSMVPYLLEGKVPYRKMWHYFRIVWYSMASLFCDGATLHLHSHHTTLLYLQDMVTVLPYQTLNVFREWWGGAFSLIYYFLLMGGAHGLRLLCYFQAKIRKSTCQDKRSKQRVL